MAEGAYNIARAQIAQGIIVLTSSGGGLTASTMKAMLVSTGYVFDPDQDVIGVAGDSTSLPFNYEPSTTTGYARQTLGARTVTENDGTNTADIDAADLTFAAVSSGAGVIGGLVVLAEIAANDSSGRRLVSFHNTNFPVTPNGGDITISLSTAGFLQFTT